MNPSLANRLRIGFAITFALLAGVTVIGVGRLFQLRQDFEDDTTRSFQVEIAGEHLRQAFLVEQTTLRDGPRARGTYRRAVSSANRAAADARALASGDEGAEGLVQRRIVAERRWRRAIARPTIAGRSPPPTRQARFADRVIRTGDDLIGREITHREALRDDVAGDTRMTALLVGVGLISGLIAAVLLFSGLIASMRRPLERLVGAAGSLADGDLRARVSVGGPAETATLGTAFNEMADQLQSAYRRVEESRERLAITLESLSDGVITVDQTGVVSDANPAARRLLPEASPGTQVRGALSGPIPARQLERMLAGREQEEIHIGEGNAILAITASTLGGEEGEGQERGAVLSVRDISERARLEHMKDEFVLTASHELRSPLTSVQGFAELLMLEREKLDPKQAETVEIILDNTRHLVRLLNDLLDLARSDAGRLTISPVTIDVPPLIEDSVRTMRAQTTMRHQTLETEIEPDLPQINVEPDRIRQVLVNLLSNARDYCQDGATIRVTAARVDDDVEIAVADDGPGIPKAQVEHIFERFTRGDAGLTQRVGGTGLGLAISKSLVELHGGSIHLSSTEGVGSTFRIVLPALQPTAEEVDATRVMESS
ncbi:MAG TPA: ATP-binding protein [Solirubrobacterales bacterium]|nr:ATP-binding protein [Solirubrobacterales bacterium]